MNRDPIVFAMANPDPEVMPEDALNYARILATGRSDYPNQINNVLAFPGIFRGALDVRASQITEEMKTAAARAIADIVSADELREDYIIPSVFNREVVPAVADAVAEEARESGTAEAGAEVGFAQTEEFRVLPGRDASGGLSRGNSAHDSGARRAIGGRSAAAAAPGGVATPRRRQRPLRFHADPGRPGSSSTISSPTTLSSSPKVSPTRSP